MCCFTLIYSDSNASILQSYVIFIPIFSMVSKLLGTRVIVVQLPDATTLKDMDKILLYLTMIKHSKKWWGCMVLGMYWIFGSNIAKISMNLHVGIYVCTTGIMHMTGVVYCTLLWFGNSWSYPYPSGLLDWHWGNLVIAPVPMKQHWRIWINHTNSLELMIQTP